MSAERHGIMTHMTHAPPPIGILLAAGLGTRFDASGRQNKLLAPLPDGRPLAVASAHALLAVLPRVIAVVRPGQAELEDLLMRAGCETVSHHATARGMGASLSVGVQTSLEIPPATLAHLQGWLVALADMPHLQTLTIRAVVAALDNSDAIAAPRYLGQRGHPVGFGAAHAAALSALDGDTGARALLREGKVTWVDVDDPGVLHDIDTPDDLAAQPTALV